MITATLYPTLGNHIMNTATYANSAFDGYATPSIGLEGGISRRALLKFSLPAATLVYTSTLSIKPQSNANSDNYYVYRIKKNITNAVTWNKFNGSTVWDTAGGYSATDIDTTALGAFGGPVSYGTYFDISLNTAEILKMMNGTYPNYGLLIKNSESVTYMSYYNYNDATETNRPKLYLEYSTFVPGAVWF